MHTRNMSDGERVEDGGAWDAAIDLARWVISNGGPPTMPSPVVLDPGELLLLSVTNPASFDSRYFGPVSASAVIGVAHPVWLESRP